MAAPKNARFTADFDEWFPQGLFLVGEIHAVTEYQSPEDREKSFPVEFACAHQPVHPEAIAGLPFRPVVLEDMMVAPRAEASGQAKWITWTVRATGMRAPGAAAASASAAGKPALGKAAAGPVDTTGRAAA